VFYELQSRKGVTPNVSGALLAEMARAIPVVSVEPFGVGLRFATLATDATSQPGLGTKTMILPAQNAVHTAKT